MAPGFQTHLKASRSDSCAARCVAALALVNISARLLTRAQVHTIWEELNMGGGGVGVGGPSPALV